jgi:8-oxo-dGTP pyrophosphatase MutT (NUDIX family)
MLTAALASLRAMSQPVADRDAVLQAAALCLRPGAGGPAGGTEVLLVTSLGTGRWVLPKGWPMKGRTLAGAALREAWEEAGVRGTVIEPPVGRYGYEKIRKGRLPLRCQVSVFRVQVDALADTWPEHARRRRVWMPVAEAAQVVAEPDLKSLLLGLAED